MIKCVMSNHAFILLREMQRNNNSGLEMICKWQEVRAF